MKIHPGHFVAIVGGAVAGAEAAAQLTSRGIHVAIFEQNPLPYGKIEDGLPKWHVKLRDKEEQRIDDKISDPRVFYIPCTKLGEDISFDNLVNNWGFSAVFLATGAWRDRPLPVEGIETFLNKGFYRQNSFVAWFNHYHEPEYQGPQFEIHDNAVVVGGGLASLDVVKILMIETVQRALETKGHEIDMFRLEREGVVEVLEELGLSLKDLGVTGCTLYYRRRIIDMPISPAAPAGATPERIEKVHQVRQKIMNNFQTKYLFDFKDQHMPVELIVEDDRLVGLIFQKTEVVGGKARAIPGSEFEVRTPLVVSSVGSIPERIPSIPVEGEVFKILDEETGSLEGFPNVFALGNAVTGRGNIKESSNHGKKVAQWVLDNHFKWSETDFQRLTELTSSNGEKLESFAKEKNLLSIDRINALLTKIHDAQQKVGYDGNYEKWREKHLCTRLENLLSLTDVPDSE
jgi:ferredoxin/flavodoxin---NADP+ reductase